MKLLKSKAVAWCAMLLVIVVIVLTFPARSEWWLFFDIFFAFMMVFCHLAALYLEKLVGHVARKLETCVFVFAVLTVLSLIVELLLMSTI